MEHMVSAWVGPLDVVGLYRLRGLLGLFGDAPLEGRCPGLVMGQVRARPQTRNQRRTVGLERARVASAQGPSLLLQPSAPQWPKEYDGGIWPGPSCCIAAASWVSWLESHRLQWGHQRQDQHRRASSCGKSSLVIV